MKVVGSRGSERPVSIPWLMRAGSCRRVCIISHRRDDIEMEALERRTGSKSTGSYALNAVETARDVVGPLHL